MAMSSGYEFDIAVSAVAIMITIGGMLLGLGHATNNKKLKEWGRDELNQCIINGILLGGMLALFLPSGPITSMINQITLANGVVKCPQTLSANAAICFSYGYLTGDGYYLGGIYHASILSQSTTLIIEMLGLNTALGLISSLKISIIAISFSLNQVFLPILGQIQFFIKALSTVSIGILVQSSILSVISASATTILLPIGIVLRTFYPTRRLGGFLIGSTIGLYVVLPLTYVLNASILSAYSLSIDNSTITSLYNSASNMSSYLSAQALPTSIWNSIISPISGIASHIASLSSQFMNNMEGYLSYFLLSVFILPAFSLAITAISIKEISKLLGSEVSFNLFEVL